MKETKCRFCGKSLHVQVDPALDELGLGVKLQGMACCDRCGTFREKRRTLIESLKNICEAVHTRSYNEKDTDTRDVVTKLLRRYMELVSKYKNVPTPAWEESITDGLLRCPMQYQEVINNLSRICSQSEVKLL